MPFFLLRRHRDRHSPFLESLIIRRQRVFWCLVDDSVQFPSGILQRNIQKQPLGFLFKGIQFGWYVLILHYEHEQSIIYATAPKFDMKRVNC